MIFRLGKGSDPYIYLLTGLGPSLSLIRPAVSAMIPAEREPALQRMI